MATQCRLLAAAGLVVATAAVCAACHRVPAQWHEVTDYEGMPPWRGPTQARPMARLVAARHARQKMAVWIEQAEEDVDGQTTIGRLAESNPRFYAEMIEMVARLEPEDVPDPADGIVGVRLRIDVNRIRRAARRYLDEPAPAVSRRR